jgi:WD40 repeat protein/serine/threonine protein kinase
MSAELKPSPGTREREIFLGALERSGPAERTAFLEAECRHDQALRRRVEELLHEQAEVGAFLETPAAAGARDSTAVLGPGGTALIAVVTEKPGDNIGLYKLLQQIGEGGCGVVYMAEQERPVRRRVALKVIKLGMDTKSVIARFEAERQALAMMDHPNIAKVLDAGATETGRPYFVMELVRGIRITEYCDQNHLPTRERLMLFIKVCQAIQHAHQKGIIHRDIKPSNILVTLHDGVPVPKVIDFGIAKATEQRLTEKTLFTEFQSFIGTPVYMSPEQAEMSGLDIDTRSDIYALGVLLYELLVGRTPFDPETLLRAGLDECRRTIREEEPIRPSTRLATLVAADLTTTAQQRHTESLKLIHLLRGDLDWIAMKCLEKDRARRYATANDLAADIQRHLDSEPVEARPPSNLYRFQKFSRRHRGAFAAVAGIAATLVAGAAISAWQAVRATNAEHRALASQKQESHLRQQAELERARAEQQNAAARLNEYVADINLAQQSLSAGNLGRAFQLLNKHQPAPGESDLRGFEWRYLWQLCQGDEHVSLPTRDGGVQSLAVSPDGEWLATASREGFREKVNVWNIRSRSLVKSLPSRGGVSVAFLPRHHALVTAGASVRVWRTADWSEEISLPESTGPIAVSPDGARLATGSRDGVRVWDTATWQHVRLLPNAYGVMAFAPDGKSLVTDSKAGLTVWPLQGTGAEIVLDDSTNVFVRSGPWLRNDRALAFSPDGKWIVAPQNTLSERGVFVINIWDAQTGRISEMPDDPEHIEHTGVISSLAFSPDGQTLASASMDHSIRLWNFPKRERILTRQGHLSEVWTVAFTPDGRTLVSGAKDGVKLWPIHDQPKDDSLPGTWQPLAISKDNRTLAALNRQGAVAFWNLATSETEEQFQLGLPRFRFPPSSLTIMSAVSISEDFKTVAHAFQDGSVKLWNPETHETNTLKVSDRPVELVVLSPDGGTLLTSGRGRNLRLWDLRNGMNTVLATEGHRSLFSRDGRTLASLSRGNTIELWDVASHSLRTNLTVDAQLGFESAVAFSADGRLLAVACSDDTIRLLEVATGRPIGTCTGHKQGVLSVAFAPDGKTLATAIDDSTLKFWNVATQQELLTVRRLGGALRGLVFSPDGRWLVGGGSFSLQSGGLRFFRAPLFSETDLAKTE